MSASYETKLDSHLNRNGAIRRKNGDTENLMDETAKVSVLLVGDSPKVFSSCRRHLDKNGCQCEFAECEREVWSVLEQRQFDIVLSVHKGRSNGAESLGALLSGSRSTLFYALPVENGCWWVSILRVGEECFGAPALRPTEFASVLDEIVERIKAGFASRAIPIRRAKPASFKRDRKLAHSRVANVDALQPVCMAPLKDEAEFGGCATDHSD